MQVLDSLKSELPTYLAICNDTLDDIDLLGWWEQHILSWGKAWGKALSAIACLCGKSVLPA